MIICVLVTLAACGNFAYANVALNPGSVTWPAAYQQYGPVTCGWKFQPNQDIVVTKLGLHLPNVAPWSSGFKEIHQIAIWDSDGIEVVSGTIPSGVPAASGDNNYVYIDVLSVTLSSSKAYIIGAYFASEADPWINTFATGYGSDPAITIIQTGMYTLGSSFQMPTILSSYLSSPNFQFTTAPTNQPPIAVDDIATTEAGSSVTIDVLANDYDIDNDALSVTDVTTPQYGSAVINADNTVTYTANVNFVGTDTFDYTISDGKGGADTATVTITVVPKEVAIDIKPGSYPNTIDLGSNGVVPVGILSSESFNATTVNPETVLLAGAGVAIRGKGNKYLAHEEDVNGDGLMDLVVQVETENLDPGQFQDGYAILTGATYGGQAIQGSDEIIIVPP